ncbi:MAG TPA: DUF1428 family protein [Phototrophicaceae bacterium]|nr:DUF1428 family protein [Phototrophicaceae bacterium]
MSQTNSEERHGENESIVLLFIDRAPKKNHDAMVQLNSRVIDTFKKYGVQRFEVFQLGSTEDMMDFVNISKTVSADQDDEVWMEIQSYRDRKHLEEVGAKMMSDKNMAAEGQQFLNLITPGSRCSFGEFSRLKGLGFV